MLGGYFCGGGGPGAFQQIAVRQADLAGLRIDLLDPHLDRLALLEHVAGMLDAAPGQLADVQQAVDAAEIDEGAEIHELPHHAVADLARLERVEHLLPGLLRVRVPRRPGG